MMTPRSLCALIVLSGAASVAMAEPGPQVLTAPEMDAIAAGASPSAGVGTAATAIGDIVFTQTSGTALTVADHSLGNDPTATGYVAVGAGVAAATALGDGATTSTSVTPSASVPGQNVVTYTINQHQKGGAAEISTGAVLQFNTYATPLQLVH